MNNSKKNPSKKKTENKITSVNFLFASKTFVYHKIFTIVIFCLNKSENRKITQKTLFDFIFWF